MNEPAIKVVAMPRDANPEGDMFGGWILSMMDLAAYIPARKISRHKLVTVAIDQIVFHQPVFIGDCIECFATVEKVGRTSITVKVDVMVERFKVREGAPNEKVKVTEGRFVYVAIDRERKPVPVHGA
jgi:acyl-CoA thioesterase YciA